MELSVAIVQQGVWHMAKESMPLAAGYLAATLRQDPSLKDRCDVRIHNFPGSKSALEMAIELLSLETPDVVGFSVLGWNVKQFSAVAETIKQVNPNALIVFGGNHVANQADRVMRQCHAVDVIVNGEGEMTFADVIRAHLDGRQLATVLGISIRRAAVNEILTTESQARISDLDSIPSPILSGAIPLVTEDGVFRYDVALMETNRGCPYKCSFCYWGGAVGQKVRSFSRERLKAELEALARASADTVVLCDANFGMLRQDAEFVENLIEVRSRYGFPRALETSWAKNKSQIFYDIVSRLKREGIRSSFTLALQTLDEPTLSTMNRRNMKINDWRGLADWLAEQDMQSYAELIWGAPGQTPQSFLAGYDELAEHVSRIAAYPLLLLPNTEYSDFRERHGFVTVRGDRDDFEYVLSSRGVSLEENLLMHRFLFWARLLAENLVLRELWPVMRATLGWSQSRVILSIADYVEHQEGTGATLVRDAAAGAVADPDSLAPALEFCFKSNEFDRLIDSWFEAVIAPTAGQWSSVLLELLHYDLDCRPLPHPDDRGLTGAQLIERDGELGWEINRIYNCDVLTVGAQARTKVPVQPPENGPFSVRLRYKYGFAELARSTNHEEAAHFVAVPEAPGRSRTVAQR